MRDLSQTEIEKLYRAVADGEPRREILQMMHDLFGRYYGLRPPDRKSTRLKSCR